MSEDEMFKVLQVLEIIEGKINNDANSCELNYYIRLREELERKLQVFLEGETCGVCPESCGNDHCITKRGLDE